MLKSFFEKTPLSADQTIRRTSGLCQLNLTNSEKFLILRGDLLTSPRMNKLGSAVSALTLAASLEAGAQSAETNNSLVMQQATFTLEQVDCVAHVKNERDIRAEAGEPMSRREQKVMLLECRNANTDALIAQQETLIAQQRAQIAALEATITQNRMRLDANGQILDEYDRVIAELVLVGDQLALQRRTNEDIASQNSQIKGRIAELDAETELLRADTQRMLDEAERILSGLAS